MALLWGSVLVGCCVCYLDWEVFLLWLCTGSVEGNECSSNGDVGTNLDDARLELRVQNVLQKPGCLDIGVAQGLGLGRSVSYLVMQRRGNAKSNINVHHIRATALSRRRHLASGTAKLPSGSALGAEKSMPHHVPAVRTAARGGGCALCSTRPPCGSTILALLPSGAAPGTINAVTQACSPPPLVCPCRVDLQCGSVAP